jgi:hypothetical protein
MRCVDCLPLIEEYFDGEVEQRMADRMSAHLASCEDCSAALDALSFEQEVYKRYDRGLEVTPALWARVSAEIAREPFNHSRIEDRPFLSRVRATLAAALSTLAARPALASSLALLLVGVTAGSLWLAHVRRDVTPRDVVMNIPPSESLPSITPRDTNGGVNLTATPSETPSEFTPTEGTPIRGEGGRESESASSYREAPRPRTAHDDSLSDADVSSLLGAQSAAQQGGIRTVEFRTDERAPRAEDSPAFVKVGGGDVDVVTTNAQLLDPSEKEIARHVEQAQMLLRSIKNARAESGDTFNVAYEKKLSRRLLGENATLQLDAETRGDRDTKQVLDRIEPYLLDIANMHDNASREEVRSVKDRIDRKEIIAALQVY